MNTTERSIWIYVTDIESKTQKNIASKTLNSEPSILVWSIDNEDIDNVLRVEVDDISEQFVQLTLENQGLMCKPMID